jgi:hypothetical protein
MDQSNGWNSQANDNDPLYTKGDCVATRCYPGVYQELCGGSQLPGCEPKALQMRRRSTYWIDESAEIEHHRVEYDDAHRLQRITIDDVARDDRISYLKSHSNC